MTLVTIILIGAWVWITVEVCQRHKEWRKKSGK